MNLSFLFLFVVICIVLLALTSSERTALRAGISGTAALGFTYGYVMMETGFGNLSSFSGMSAYFYYLFEDFFIRRGIEEDAGFIIGEAIWLFILFLAFFLVFYIILSFFPLGRSPRKRKITIGKVIGGLLFIASFSFTTVYLLSAASPLFNIPLGPLSSFFGMFAKRLIV